MEESKIVRLVLLCDGAGRDFESYYITDLNDLYGKRDICPVFLICDLRYVLKVDERSTVKALNVSIRVSTERNFCTIFKRKKRKNSSVYKTYIIFERRMFLLRL